MAVMQSSQLNGPFLPGSTNYNTPSYSAPMSVPGAFNFQGNYSNAGANGVQATNPVPAKQGQVLGANTFSGGGGGGNQNTTVTQGPSLSDQINSIFNPVNDYLGQAQSTLQGAYPQIQSDINSQFQTSLNSLGQQNTAGNQQIDTQAQQAQKRETDAMNAAVQLYNELKAGGQQRFGGASSAGQAYGELTGRQLQQQQGGIQSQGTETMNQLNMARQQLNDKYNLAIQTLNDQKTAALHSAQQEYNDKLLQISQLKSQNESAKASAQMEALQNLRNQVYSINLQALQQSSSVQNQYTQNQQAINAYIQQAGSALSGGDSAVANFMNSSTVNPNNAFSMGYTPQASQQAPVGAYVSPKKDQYGNALP